MQFPDFKELCNSYNKEQINISVAITDNQEGHVTLLDGFCKL
jgi:hypothetical protein